MAPRAERPPSERGPAYETLDALAELRDQVAELATGLAARPMVGGGHPPVNWWDVLSDPREYGFPWSWPEVISGYGGTMNFYLPIKRSDAQVLVMAATYDDRVELALRLNGMHTVWQRALFFARPPGV